MSTRPFLNSHIPKFCVFLTSFSLCMGRSPGQGPGEFSAAKQQTSRRWQHQPSGEQLLASLGRDFPSLSAAGPFCRGKEVFSHLRTSELCRGTRHNVPGLAKPKEMAQLEGLSAGRATHSLPMRWKMQGLEGQRGCFARREDVPSAGE